VIKTIPGSWVPPVKDSFGLNWPESVSLYIVWQTGTALLVGWLVTGEREASAPDSLPLTAAPLRPRAPRTKIAFAGVFFCAVLGFLGWFVVRDEQVKRYLARSDQEFKTAAARRDKAFKQYIAEAPPVAGLPPIQALGAQHALILEDVAGFRAENPSARPCSQQPLFSGAGLARGVPQAGAGADQRADRSRAGEATRGWRPNRGRQTAATKPWWSAVSEIERFRTRDHYWL